MVHLNSESGCSDAGDRNFRRANERDGEKRFVDGYFSSVCHGLTPGFGWPEVVVLAILPALLWPILPIQLFPPPGWVDPMFYVGYFLKLADSLHRFGAQYYGMRLPWVISGLAAHRLFSPTGAHLAIVFAYNLIAVSSLYLIVTPRSGRLTGLAASLFLTLNPLWVAAVTRGYVDGPAIAFGLAALAAAANTGRLWDTARGGLFAGMMGSLAIYTNPIGGVQAALTILAWLLLDRIPWREVCILTTYALVSFVGVTVGLGLVSIHFGGPFFFFMASLNETIAAVHGHGAMYARPQGTWLPSAYGLFPFIGLLFLGGAILIWAGGVTDRVRLLFSGWCVLALAVIAFAIVDYSLQGVLLQTSFYLSYLIPGQALIFAGLVDLAIHSNDGLHPRYVVAWFGALIAAGCVPFVIVNGLWSAENLLRAWLGMWTVLAALIVFAVVLLRSRATLFAPIAVLLAVCLAGATNADTKRIFRVGDNVEYRPLYRAAIRLNTLVQSHIGGGQKLLIWYQRAESTTGDSNIDNWMTYRLYYGGKPIDLTPYDSFASLWLWDRSILGVSMPALTGPELDTLRDSKQAVIVILCTNVALCYAGVDVLKNLGRSVALREIARIEEGAYVNLNVMVLSLSQ